MDKLKLILSLCLIFVVGVSSAKIAKGIKPPTKHYRQHPIPLIDCPNLNENKCLNNEDSLKCYLKTVSFFFRDETGCDAFFYQTSCTPSTTFDALKSFCPYTISQYCPEPLSYSFLPNHQYAQLIAGATYNVSSPTDHIAPFVKEIAKLFSKVTCEEIVKQYGCYSTSAIFSSEIMIEYCAATYYDYCKDAAILANGIVQYEKTAQEIMLLSQSACVPTTTTPTTTEEITKPTTTKKVTEPTTTQKVTEPTTTEKVTEPTTTKKVTEPTTTEKVTEPTTTEKVTEPTTTEKVTEPTTTEKVTEPTTTEKVTEPTTTEKVTEPTTTKKIHESTAPPVTFPSVVAPSFTSGFIAPISEDGWSSSFYSKGVLAAITITIGLLASP